MDRGQNGKQACEQPVTGFSNAAAAHTFMTATSNRWKRVIGSKALERYRVPRAQQSNHVECCISRSLALIISAATVPRASWSFENPKNCLRRRRLSLAPNTVLRIASHESFLSFFHQVCALEAYIWPLRALYKLQPRRTAKLPPRKSTPPGCLNYQTAKRSSRTSTLQPSASTAKSTPASV